MNILDLKKLMLVPLACCVLVQQTDATTQADNYARAWISPGEEPGTIIDEFKRLVNDKESDESARMMPEHIRVAHSMNILKGRSEWGDYQMGGLIAFVPDKKVPKVRVYAGVKRRSVLAADNRINTYDTNAGSHTERQLIGTVIKNHKSLSGDSYIYTPVPPCAGQALPSNGNVNCCSYYARVLEDYKGANLHIFFRSPRLTDLKGWIRFDSPDKLLILKTFAIQVLGKGVFGKAVQKRIANRGHINILESLDGGNPPVGATAVQYQEVAGELFDSIELAWSNRVGVFGDDYNKIIREGTKEYNVLVEKVYKELMGTYTHSEEVLKRIRFYVIE